MYLPHGDSARWLAVKDTWLSPCAFIFTLSTSCMGTALLCTLNVVGGRKMLQDFAINVPCTHPVCLQRKEAQEIGVAQGHSNCCLVREEHCICDCRSILLPMHLLDIRLGLWS